MSEIMQFDELRKQAIRNRKVQYYTSRGIYLLSATLVSAAFFSAGITSSENYSLNQKYNQIVQKNNELVQRQDLMSNYIAQLKKSKQDQAKLNDIDFEPTGSIKAPCK